MKKKILGYVQTPSVKTVKHTDNKPVKYTGKTQLKINRDGTISSDVCDWDIDKPNATWE